MKPIRKAFYVDVIYKPIDKEEAEKQNLYYIEDNNRNCFLTIVKDVNQLKEVFEYYKS